jgi:hypothetical protein
MLSSFAAIPAQAQRVPPGSYLRSCTHVAVYADRLLADCRRADGSWRRAALRDVDRCAGDIGNMNGQLVCNRGERNYGSRARNRDYERWNGDRRNYDPGPGYGSSSGYRGDWSPGWYPFDHGR